MADNNNQSGASLNINMAFCLLQSWNEQSINSSATFLRGKITEPNSDPKLYPSTGR